VTGTPCQHLPGGEVTGFILQADKFGINQQDGKPNVIFISGDTVYFEELAKTIQQKYHVVTAILNFGAATVPIEDPPLVITLDGKQGAKLFREIGADVLVPMHYASWTRFAQKGDELAKELEKEGVQDKVRWLTPGKSWKII
jgi:L-ascorbate metabolism protein UlaG (beta-lactamase superfamily)